MTAVEPNAPLNIWPRYRFAFSVPGKSVIALLGLHGVFHAPTAGKTGGFGPNKIQTAGDAG